MAYRDELGRIYGGGPGAGWGVPDGAPNAAPTVNPGTSMSGVTASTNPGSAYSTLGDVATPTSGPATDDWWSDASTGTWNDGGYYEYTPTTGYHGTNSPVANDPNVQGGDWLAKHWGEMQVPYTFTLPNTGGAMGNLRELQQTSATGMTELLGRDTAAERSALEKVLYEHSKEPIVKDATDLFHAMNENTFGRGMGMSSVGTENVARWGQEVQDALARAGRESYFGAGDELRKDLAAQMAALGQGFSAGTEGLGLEANVGLTNTGRWQQAATHGLDMAFEEYLNRTRQDLQESQFARELAARLQMSQASLGQQGSQFDRQLALQRELQTMGFSQQDAQFLATMQQRQSEAATSASQFDRSLAQQREMQDRAFQLAQDNAELQGLGGLASLLSVVFGPTIGGLSDSALNQLAKMFGIDLGLGVK